MENAFENTPQFFHLHRLGHEIVGAFVNGAETDSPFALSGDHDDLGQAVQGGQLRQRGQTLPRVGRTRRQPQIQQDHQGPGRLKRFQSARPVAGENNIIIAGQRPFHLGAYLLVVINNEQFRVHLLFSFAGKSTLKVVPLFG